MLDKALEAISEMLRPGYARIWLYQPNGYLDGDTPADRIAAGDIRSVSD